MTKTEVSIAASAINNGYSVYWASKECSDKILCAL